MADPINSNLLSNTCPNPTSSNCVLWNGPRINGVCAGASITDVIMQLNSCCNSIIPSTIYAPGYGCVTGNWVDFTSTIVNTPIVGTSATTIIPVSGYGTSVSGAVDFPSYKWTSDGNLLIRGGLLVSLYHNSATSGFEIIDLATIPPTCFPINFTKTQDVLTDVNTIYLLAGNTPFINALKYYLRLDFATGKLQLVIIYDYTNINAALNLQLITLSAQFNLG